MHPYNKEEEYDEIDIMELVRKLLREWKLILVWCGIAAVVGGISLYIDHMNAAAEAASATTISGISRNASISATAVPATAVHILWVV